MVPTANLIIMAVNALLGFAIPVFLCWWAVKKHQAKLSTILIGAGTFVVFALVLESIVHQIVLKGPSGAVIQGKTLYYALYGGLMAGLFEETGRFLAMKFLLKKEPTETKPGVSYGLGHGGVEMAIIFGLSMISTLTMAIMVNLGQTDTLLEGVDGRKLAAVEQERQHPEQAGHQPGPDDDAVPFLERQLMTAPSDEEDGIAADNDRQEGGEQQRNPALVPRRQARDDPRHGHQGRDEEQGNADIPCDYLPIHCLSDSGDKVMARCCIYQYNYFYLCIDKINQAER